MRALILVMLDGGLVLLLFLLLHFQILIALILVMLDGGLVPSGKLVDLFDDYALILVMLDGGLVQYLSG